MTSSDASQQTTARCALARPLPGGAILVEMWTEGRLREGPWSFVTDPRVSQRQMLGPPPIYLALAGWAT